MNNMDKQLHRRKEGPKAKIHISLLRTAHKKYQTPVHNIIDAYLFLKKFSSIHNILALKMNTFLEEIDIPKGMTKEKTTLIQKDP